MKQVFLLLGVAALLSFSASAERVQVKPDKIPYLAKNQLKAYFPQAQVAEATKEKSKIKNNYEVLLDDGTQLEFDKDGNWLFVDLQGRPVPQRMIPGQVLNYLNGQFEGSTVVKMIKDKDRNLTVFLQDGTQITFDNYMKHVQTIVPE